MPSVVELGFKRPGSLPELVARLDEVNDHYNDAIEAHAEIDAQYRAEIRMFGDAWPGAAKQLADGRRATARLFAEIEYLEDYLAAEYPVLGPEFPGPRHITIDDGEDPF